MKRLAMVSCLALLPLAGCGSDTPTTPSNTTVFTINLLPSNEVPPLTDASESGGRGTAVITVHQDSNTIDFQVNMQGFPSDTVIRAAHIHPGAAGVAGGVLVNTGLSNPVTLTGGTGQFSFPGVSTSADNVNNILANPQNFYFNIHSVKNGAGVARGQLR